MVVKSVSGNRGCEEGRWEGKPRKRAGTTDGGKRTDIMPDSFAPPANGPETGLGDRLRSDSAKEWGLSRVDNPHFRMADSAYFR